MALQPVSPEPRFQRIDDVEQACKLREAGLLWRCYRTSTPRSLHILPEYWVWTSAQMRVHWDELTVGGAYFGILLED